MIYLTGIAPAQPRRTRRGCRGGACGQWGFDGKDKYIRLPQQKKPAPTTWAGFRYQPNPVFLLILQIKRPVRHLNSPAAAVRTFKMESALYPLGGGVVLLDGEAAGFGTVQYGGIGRRWGELSRHIRLAVKGIGAFRRIGQHDAEGRHVRLAGSGRNGDGPEEDGRPGHVVRIERLAVHFGGEAVALGVAVVGVVFFAGGDDQDGGHEE